VILVRVRLACQREAEAACKLLRPGAAARLTTSAHLFEEPRLVRVRVRVRVRVKVRVRVRVGFGFGFGFGVGQGHGARGRVRP
tara:strand:+ start:94 stop:342 length:249 start_codon:yes stop_codon:yes gene_type:complete